jgi:hypothetical protein
MFFIFIEDAGRLAAGRGIARYFSVRRKQRSDNTGYPTGSF